MSDLTLETAAKPLIEASPYLAVTAAQEEIINRAVGNSALLYALVGSSFTLGKGSDVDLLVLVGDIEVACQRLEAAGYELEGEESYDTSTFFSYRMGDINILVTESASFFSSFIKAACVCRCLRLADKEDRKTVHRIIMEDTFQ